MNRYSPKYLRETEELNERVNKLLDEANEIRRLQAAFYEAAIKELRK